MSEQAEDEWLSVTQCATYHEVTRATVHNWIKNGKFSEADFRKIGNSYVIRKRACEEYKPIKDPSELGKLGARKREENKREGKDGG